MGEAAIRAVRTDWQGVALTLLLPLLVAASFASLALQPWWQDDSPDWAFGMLALLPFEFVRVIVFWILRDAYADFRSPARAVRFYLLSLLVLAAIALFIALLNLGIRDTFHALADPVTWRLILPPALVIAVDGVIALYFFRGDPDCQAARLDAQGGDAEDWLCLAIYGLPLLVALPAFVILVRSQRGEWLPSWLPPGTDGIRSVFLLYAAVYFAGKGLLLAHAYSARFQGAGARVLSADWVQFLLVRDGAKRAANAKAEARNVSRRLCALGGGRFSRSDD